jgi:periplasmic protein TonB
MNNSPIDRLNESIDCLFAGEQPNAGSDPAVLELFAVANEIHQVPAPEFRERLRSELAREAFNFARRRDENDVLRRDLGSSIDHQATAQRRDTPPPPLFCTGTASFPLSASRLALSFALHVIALALVGASSMYVFRSNTVRTKMAQLVPSSADFLFPVAPGKIGGGGGGGDHDKMSASKGTPPRFSAEQLTPPSIVVRNEDPKLPAEPTVVGPPDLLLPKSDKLGDPLAAALSPPSNGTGGGGGIGNGFGGGVGPGNGPGVGDGVGGGFGGGVLRVGGGVSAPRPLYDPDPEYSDEARKAKHQGNVVLEAVIGADGHPRSLRVVRSLGMGLDQKALDAVAKWRFSPAMKDGHAVNVLVDIEVAFRLY